MSDYALHPEALADIDDIWQYVANDSVDAADRVIETIFENIATVAASPQQGHPRPDLTSAPLLFWRVYSYLIVYAPTERPLSARWSRPRDPLSKLIPCSRSCSTIAVNSATLTAKAKW